jgi:hypothetical protein
MIFFSSSSFFASKVTESRIYAPASSHGTVEISFSRIKKSEKSAADAKHLPS